MKVGKCSTSPGRCGTGLVLALVLLLSLGLWSCGSCVASPPASTATMTPVTDLSKVLDLAWSPADSPTQVDRDAIGGALATHDLIFLLPSSPPVADSARVSAQFLFWETVPTHEDSVELVVRQNDEPAGPLVALQSWKGAPPSGMPAGQAVQIRGKQGHAGTTSGGVSMLDWVESDQNYHAEWSGLPVQEVIDWLDTWAVIPSAGATTSGSTIAP